MGWDESVQVRRGGGGGGQSWALARKVGTKEEENGALTRSTPPWVFSICGRLREAVYSLNTARDHTGEYYYHPQFTDEAGTEGQVTRLRLHSEKMEQSADSPVESGRSDGGNRPGGCPTPAWSLQCQEGEELGSPLLCGRAWNHRGVLARAK